MMEQSLQIIITVIAIIISLRDKLLSLREYGHRIYKLCTSNFEVLKYIDKSGKKRYCKFVRLVGCGLQTQSNSIFFRLIRA